MLPFNPLRELPRFIEALGNAMAILNRLPSTIAARASAASLFESERCARRRFQRHVTTNSADHSVMPRIRRRPLRDFIAVYAGTFYFETTEGAAVDIGKGLETTRSIDASIR